MSNSNENANQCYAHDILTRNWYQKTGMCVMQSGTRFFWHQFLVSMSWALNQKLSGGVHTLTSTSTMISFTDSSKAINSNKNKT